MPAPGQLEFVEQRLPSTLDARVVAVCFGRQEGNRNAERTIGSRSTRPHRRSRGTRGTRRTRGAGDRGQRGPGPTRDQILEAVHAEFDELRKQLQVQIERTAQMQQQLDAIQNLLKRALHL